MNIFIHQNILSHNLDPVLYTPLLAIVRDSDLPFHLEGEKYNFVKTVNEAKIIPVLKPPLTLNNFIISDKERLSVSYNLMDQEKFIKKIDNTQWIVIMYHAHAAESHNLSIKNRDIQCYSNITNNVLTVDLNRNYGGISHIFYDFCFNLTKALFTEYDKFDFRTRVWTQSATKESFILNEIKPFVLTKRFLIPNIIRNSSEFKEIARTRIKLNIIKEDDCYFSDPLEGIYLEPKEIHCAKHHDPDGVGLIPISDYYYHQSAVSVFSETISSCHTGVKVISEKTFIPLVRGHYILPFGYAGMIKDIKSYGFMLPDWIDYSYDLIDNDYERLDKFVESVNKLRLLTLDQLEEKANNDIPLLNHNRNIFFTRPYDSLYDKLVDRINELQK